MKFPKREKVAIIHPDLGIGGAERLILDTALELVSAGNDVSFTSAKRTPLNALPATKR